MLRLNIKHREAILVVTISVLLFFVPMYKVLSLGGYIILSEHLEAISYEKFESLFKYSWDYQIGIFPLAEFPKYYLYSLLVFVGRTFHLDFKYFEIILLGLQFPIGFLSAYMLNRYIAKKLFNIQLNKLTEILILILIVASLVYVLNPWVASYQHNISLKFQHALLPLVYLYFLKTIQESSKTVKNAIIGAFFISLVASYRYLTILIPLFALTIILYIISNRNLGSMKETVIKIAIYTFLAIMLMLGKFITPILYSIKSPRELEPAKEFTASYIFLEPLLNVLSAKFISNPMLSYFLIYNDSYMYLFLIITIMSLLYLIIQRKLIKQNWLYLLPVLVFVTYIPLCAKEINIFSLDLIWQIPFSDYLLRLLRSGRINYMPVLMALSTSLSFTLLSIYINIFKNRDRKIQSIFLVFTLAFILIASTSAWPIFTGDMNGYWKPAKIPKDYYIANKILKNSSENDYYALWMPPFSTAKPIWSNATNVYGIGPPAGIFDWRNSELPVYCYRKTYFFDYYNPLGIFPFVRPLEGYKGTEWDKILYPLDIKYIVIHYDLNNPYINMDKIKKKAVELNRANLNMLYNGKYLVVYEVFKENISKIRTTAPILLDDNIKMYGSLINSLDFQTLKETSVIFYNPYNLGDFSIKATKIVILSNNPLKILFSYCETISPGIYTSRKYTNPAKNWVFITGVDSYLFQVYLKKHNIYDWSWQLDYNKGVVLTWATKRIPENLEVKDSDVIYSWNFDTEKEFLEWKNVTQEKQFNAIHKLEWKEGALIAKLYNSTWGWKVIKSPFVPAEAGDIFRFKLKIRGENAHGVHIKVLEFDSNKKYLTGKYVKGVGSGTFDWKTVQFDYIVQNPNTSYIQLQIWHGHETDKPLPNVIWIDDVRVYDITKYAKPVTLEIPFKVDRNDNYKLFIRYFKNQKGGAIKVYLDDEPIVINTKDQLNKFVWKDLGTFKLKKGKHEIILENVKGFNAVNLFALIPENEYYKAKEEVEKLLQNKTIIYLFEAESDLYRENAEVSKEFGGEASNGEVLKFVKSGEAWQDIEIVKNGTYRLALKGVGEFKVRIGDHEFILKANSLNFTYTPLFNLTKGKYRLEILASKDSYLDVIWLYSTKTNQTIDQLFEVKEKPAEIINYTKINPTLWKVKVNATKPFMLSFAESYDPLWEARVYKNGKLVEKVRSIPLYSVINGFWINETGNFEIVIRYTPQDWFELGLMISATTFIGCIGYIFYDWRREKGDRWALKIERKIKEIWQNLRH